MNSQGSWQCRTPNQVGLDAAAIEEAIRENDRVVVVRWIRGDALNEFIGKVLSAVRPRS